MMSARTIDISAVFHAFAHAARCGEVWVVGKQRLEWKLEERMQGYASGVYCGDACRGEDDMPFFRAPAYVAQECRFARAGLACEEYRLPCMAYQLPCRLEFWIVEVYFLDGFVFHFFSRCVRCQTGIFRVEYSGMSRRKEYVRAAISIAQQ